MNQRPQDEPGTLVEFRNLKREPHLIPWKCFRILSDVPSCLCSDSTRSNLSTCTYLLYLICSFSSPCKKD